MLLGDPGGDGSCQVVLCGVARPVGESVKHLDRRAGFPKNPPLWRAAPWAARRPDSCRSAAIPPAPRRSRHAASATATRTRRWNETCPFASSSFNVETATPERAESSSCVQPLASRKVFKRCPTSRARVIGLRSLRALILSTAPNRDANGQNFNCHLISQKRFSGWP